LVAVQCLSEPGPLRRLQLESHQRSSFKGCSHDAQEFATHRVKIYGTSTRRQTDPVTMEPFNQFTKEDVRAIVDEARRYKRDVAAHVYGGPGAEAVILGGVRTIEHGP
jgi:imidazolonepropionase-like amidohydrolase